VGRVDPLAARGECVELLDICDAIIVIVVDGDGLECHELDAVQRVKESTVCQDDSADGLRQVVLIYPFLN
jgi:hypothetical protein